MMTRRLLDAIVGQGRSAVLVDRRFSKRVVDVGRPTVGKAFAAIGLVQRLVRSLVVHRPRVVVHFVTNRSGAFAVDVLLAVVLRIAGVRVVHYVHTNGFRALAERGVAWEAAVRFLLQTAERVVVLGATMRADVAPWVEPRRLQVIPNASDTLPLRQRQDGRGGGRQVLFFSNLLPEKGARTAVDIGVRLCQQHDGTSFVLAGAETDPAYSAELRATIRDAGMSERIRVVGAVDPVSRPLLLAASDILLFPSTYPYEAQPLSVVEAMSAGMPVVAYSIGGLPDLVTSGSTGQLIEVGDEDAMFTALEALILDSDRLEGQSAAALEEHARHHSPAAFSAAWDDLLRALEREDRT